MGFILALILIAIIIYFLIPIDRVEEERLKNYEKYDMMNF